MGSRLYQDTIFSVRVDYNIVFVLLSVVMSFDVDIFGLLLNLIGAARWNKHVIFFIICIEKSEYVYII